jgi:hypothetical protein
MEAMHLPKMLVCIYHTAQSHNPEDHNVRGSVQATGFMSFLTCSFWSTLSVTCGGTFKIIISFGKNIDIVVQLHAATKHDKEQYITVRATTGDRGQQRKQK